jgi:hypothetical protein
MAHLHHTQYDLHGMLIVRDCGLMIPKSLYREAAPQSTRSTLNLHVAVNFWCGKPVGATASLNLDPGCGGHPQTLDKPGLIPYTKFLSALNVSANLHYTRKAHEYYCVAGVLESDALVSDFTLAEIPVSYKRCLSDTTFFPRG